MPVLKITGNSKTYRNMEDDMDYNAGRVMDGEITLEQAGQEIYQEVLKIAGGKPTKAEVLGHDELFSIGRYDCF